MKGRDGYVYSLSVLIFVQNDYCTFVHQYAERLEEKPNDLDFEHPLSPELSVILYFSIVSKRQSNCEIMSKSLACLENLNFKVKYQSKT